MEITNKLLSKSFSYQQSGEALTCRIEEQEKLNEILEFCRDIDEVVYYDDTLLNTEVEDGILLYELIYGLKNGTSMDGTVFVQEMLTKKCKVKCVESKDMILCSCGECDGGAATIQEYARKRQEFLRKIPDCREYGKFMRTCFPNSVFADDCEQELIHIKDFERHKNEITDCLALLDEKAVSLYYEHQTNLIEAQNILQAMLKRTCAPDPNHKSELRFEFSYEMQVGGKMQEKKKWVECQPHFKLIRDDSDLRVYFQWQDKDVGEGEKVLIGRVGRHPWKKH